MMVTIMAICYNDCVRWTIASLQVWPLRAAEIKESAEEHTSRKCRRRDSDQGECLQSLPCSHQLATHFVWGNSFLRATRTLEITSSKIFQFGDEEIEVQ